jgi:hypothetical protein
MAIEVVTDFDSSMIEPCYFFSVVFEDETLKCETGFPTDEAAGRAGLSYVRNTLFDAFSVEYESEDDEESQ